VEQTKYISALPTLYEIIRDI